MIFELLAGLFGIGVLVLVGWFVVLVTYPWAKKIGIFKKGDGK